MNLDKKTRLGWVITSLVAGVMAGILITTRFNFTPQTQAASEQSDIANPVLSLENAFVKVADEVGQAVVSISTESTEKVGGRQIYMNPFGNDEFFNQFFKEFFGEMPKREYKRRGIGSGVIINADGFILTNQHVVEDAQKIIVTLPDGREFKGEVKGIDPRSDLAIVKISAHNLPVARLGDSDQVKIGQWSVAIGNPFGFAINNPKPTVTVGVISALDRSLPRTSRRDRLYTGLIQTDAAINPGNSGGPLVNIKGEVIGINVAIFTTSGGYEGVGFAIPINTAKSVLKNLIEGKKIVYGWLGISIQDLDEKLVKYFGLSNKEGIIVAGVLPNTPAEKAGLKEGDVIITYEGEKVKNTNDLLQKVGHAPIGQKVKLGILRNKKESEVEVAIAERPSEAEAAKSKPTEIEKWRGIAVGELTPQEAEQLGLEVSRGVIIVKIEEGSPADESGLRKGDRILSINHQPIKNLGDYQNAIKSVEGECLIRTQRGYAVLKEKIE